MPRPGNDWRETNERLDPSDMLEPNIRYRSPLWDADHLLGEAPEWANEGIAWCGRSLSSAQQIPDTGDKTSLGGLWRSTSRSGGLCNTCKSRQEEWDEGFHPVIY